MRIRFLASMTAAACALVYAGACGTYGENGDGPAPNDDASTSTDAPVTSDAGPDACGDLQSDSKNCGRCGHDCLGGACNKGNCEAVALIDFSLADNRCATPDQSVCLRGNLAGVVVDDVWVYFSDNGDINGNGGILRVRKDVVTRTKPDTLVLVGDVPFIATDVSSFYWQDQGVIYRAPKGGGIATVLSDESVVTERSQVPIIDSFASRVYFGSQNGLRLLVIGSDAGSNEAFADAGALGSIVALGSTPDALRIGYGTTVATGGNVGIFDRGDGGLHTVATGHEARGVAVEADALYWANTDGSVYRAAGESLVATKIGQVDVNPAAIAIAGDELYVATWGASFDKASAAGAVYRMPKQSATKADPVIVFKGPILASGLAVDDKAVYFTGWFAQQVYRVAR